MLSLWEILKRFGKSGFLQHSAHASPDKIPTSGPFRHLSSWFLSSSIPFSCFKSSCTKVFSSDGVCHAWLMMSLKRNDHSPVETGKYSSSLHSLFPDLVSFPPGFGSCFKFKKQNPNSWLKQSLANEWWLGVYCTVWKPQLEPLLAVEVENSCRSSVCLLPLLLLGSHQSTRLLIVPASNQQWQQPYLLLRCSNLLTSGYHLKRVVSDSKLKLS